MILVASCPGGTASNVVVFLARGKVALSVSLTLASTIAAIWMTPLLTSWYAGPYLPVDPWVFVQGNPSGGVAPLDAWRRLESFFPEIGPPGFRLFPLGLGSSHPVDCGFRASRQERAHSRKLGNSDGFGPGLASWRVFLGVRNGRSIWFLKGRAPYSVDRGRDAELGLGNDPGNGSFWGNVNGACPLRIERGDALPDREFLGYSVEAQFLF